MPKKFTVTGEVGWEINTEFFKSILEKAEGDDIIINFASPGGSVFTGLKIFNLIKNYSGNVDFHLIGEAASMGSYIPLAGRKITAEPNVVFMIHNARSVVGGDHNEMRKRADIVEGLSNLIKNEYIVKTGKSEKEIKQWMDDETFFFGDEAVDAGFVDEIIKNNKDDSDVSSKEISVALAKEAFEATMKKVKAEDYEQAAAFFNIKRGNPTVETKTKKEKANMDLNEFKIKYPDLYENVFRAGVHAERDRVTAHIIWGEASGDFKTASEAIQDGSEMTAALTAKYSVAAMNRKDVESRIDDDADLNGIDDTNTNDSDDSTIVADLVEFNMGISKGGN
jgi:ATP-dependent Clp protease protease subunit